MNGHSRGMGRYARLDDRMNGNLSMFDFGADGEAFAD